MSSTVVYDRQRSPSRPPASVDETPTSHVHLKEGSSIPSVVRADSFAITRLESPIGLADRITKVSSVPALLVSVSIKSLAIGDYQLWLDDKHVPMPYVPAFRSNVIDLDAQPSCWIGSAFDYVLFHVPRTVLDDIAADLGIDPVDTYRLSLDEEDLVLTQLTKSILPYIGQPGRPGPLALDHLHLILGAHLLQKYAGLRKPTVTSVGGLGPWQKRRATELLSENLAGRIHLSQLAKDCGLSISHFARSFKASFGVSTHRWLVQRRIERSQALLMETRESLADIADRAGFSDQAAFTRAFHQIVGISPGRWRRDYQRKESPLARVSCVRART
jgi:AraC family transcriptional regulator